MTVGAGEPEVPGTTVVLAGDGLADGDAVVSVGLGDTDVGATTAGGGVATGSTLSCFCR